MTDYTTREYIIRETAYPDATKQEAIGELVRCKDCIRWKYFNGGLGNCKHPKFGEPLTENYHFCGYGERKDGDGNG